MATGARTPRPARTRRPAPLPANQSYLPCPRRSTRGLPARQSSPAAPPPRGTAAPTNPAAVRALYGADSWPGNRRVRHRRRPNQPCSSPRPCTAQTPTAPPLPRGRTARSDWAWPPCRPRARRTRDAHRFRGGVTVGVPGQRRVHERVQCLIPPANRAIPGIPPGPPRRSAATAGSPRPGSRPPSTPAGRPAERCRRT